MCMVGVTRREASFFLLVRFNLIIYSIEYKDTERSLVVMKNICSNAQFPRRGMKNTNTT